ncbi:sulfatase-like hydrolase/transferase [Gaetbulibacter sp. M240]|uniref:LTA synthase family protein n=1 Tax=Gaetbulibacter sp. M240 TaxID=3126511 RepID=UPI00374E6165
MSKIFPSRFALFKAFVGLFLIVSFLVRLSFFVWNFPEVDKSFFVLASTFVIGSLFDLATVSFFSIPFLLYLFIFPKRFYGTVADKIITYFGFSLGLLIIYFSFFGELTFWDEFHRRYNFIAVDYLIYTYEVVQNINQSYPLPFLISGIILMVAISLFIVYKLGYFHRTFQSETVFTTKSMAVLPWMAILLLNAFYIKNSHADFSDNRYNNELAKSGIYAFFAAFKNNELPYSEFYKTIPKAEAYNMVKESYAHSRDSFINPEAKAIYRYVKNNPIDTLPPKRPNVIFICIESLSADFMQTFGNTEGITPTLDSLANSSSYFFKNLYATGTRTVRGMEAITLSIPPTPGRSIVKRENNKNLYTIGEVFKEKGYTRNFFYGGDGYFDNMNTFFGGNGFNIIDRGRGFLLDDSIKTTRTNIEDNEVTFENAWGVCDMDLYRKVIKEADKSYSDSIPFFDFVMTTSNHKPFTYPEGEIDIPSGTGRNGAVKYTDYAIKEFLKLAKEKPWYDNTVFVIMSDHCASSAGRWELDIKNYRIPAFFVNLPKTMPKQVFTLASQIDIFPTLFACLGWNYNSNFFGKDILSMPKEDLRAFVGNYRKLGYFKDNSVVILDEHKNANFYSYDYVDNSLSPIPEDDSFIKTTISFYLVADDLYRHGGLKTNQYE